MTPKELSLIKRRYCEDHFITSLVDKVTFELVKKKPNGNSVFLVTIPDKDSFHYELVKKDLMGFDEYKPMSIPKAYRNDFDVTQNKAMIAEWVNRKTGLGLIETDIASLAVSKTHITVIIAADSMRFKSDFRLIRL